MRSAGHVLLEGYEISSPSDCYTSNLRSSSKKLYISIWPHSINIVRMWLTCLPLLRMASKKNGFMINAQSLSQSRKVKLQKKHRGFEFCEKCVSSIFSFVRLFCVSERCIDMEATKIKRSSVIITKRRKRKTERERKEEMILTMTAVGAASAWEIRMIWVTLWRK